jgi:putative membrane protein
MFTERTRQWTKSLILLCMGLYFLDNMLSGRIYFYINERFGWLSWLATIIFVVLGAAGIFDLMRSRGIQTAHDHQDDHAHDEHDHHDHEHEHIHVLPALVGLDSHDHDGHNHGAAPSWLMLSIVAVPLIVGLVVPAKPLGAAAVGSNGVSTSFTDLQGSGTSTQLSVASTDRNVLDWVRSFNGAKSPDDFNGQSADLIGFVYRDIRFKDKPYFMTARFTISCCVADASAIGVTVQWPDAAKLPSDGWVHVTGTFQAQDFDGQKMPILVADTIEPTAQPEHPYLYP